MASLDFSIDDLIKDESFQQWVLKPDPALDTQWVTYLDANPTRVKDVEAARMFILSLHVREEDEFESRISDLKKRIDHAIDGNPVLAHRKVGSAQPARKVNWFRWAVAASVTAVLGYAGYQKINNRPVEVPQVMEVATPMSHHDNPKGRRSLITLEDGSQVWLNAESTLEYKTNFTRGQTREVYLTGEAFFEVAEDKKRPFMVHTSDVTIKVLGTSFNVRSYEMDKKIETTLVRGKVSIESEINLNSQVMLLPNQRAIYEKHTKKIVLENSVDTQNSTGWKEGNLTFEAESLQNIITALERWYNVEIQIENRKSLNCRYSAKINNKSLQEVLELFRVSDGIEYRIDGRDVVITGKLCDEN